MNGIFPRVSSARSASQILVSISQHFLFQLNLIRALSAQMVIAARRKRTGVKSKSDYDAAVNCLENSVQRAASLEVKQRFDICTTRIEGEKSTSCKLPSTKSETRDSSRCLTPTRLFFTLVENELKKFMHKCNECIYIQIALCRTVVVAAQGDLYINCITKSACISELVYKSDKRLEAPAFYSNEIAKKRKPSWSCEWGA